MFLKIFSKQEDDWNQGTLNQLENKLMGNGMISNYMYIIYVPSI